MQSCISHVHSNGGATPNPWSLYQSSAVNSILAVDVTEVSRSRARRLCGQPNRALPLWPTRFSALDMLPLRPVQHSWRKPRWGFRNVALLTGAIDLCQGGTLPNAKQWSFASVLEHHRAHSGQEETCDCGGGMKVSNSSGWVSTSTWFHGSLSQAARCLPMGPLSSATRGLRKLTTSTCEQPVSPAALRALPHRPGVCTVL